MAITVPTVLGMLSGSHVRLFKDIYHSFVAKPSFIPPRSAFKPIWILLYVAMGYASFLVYETGREFKVPITSALTYYILQLSFNLCWPALFFRYRNYKVSLYIITANLAFAAVTASKFYAINQLAGYLLTPYLGWLVISGYINKRIWRLNESNQKLVAINKTGLQAFLQAKKSEGEQQNLCSNCITAKTE
ncbi:hypothetical protein K502DRAFT_285565 [Neoconidiobolus thromboides FSU 785]|nr:hypothetical protein K502DRAFT_285565 [Neoconidiobolus thromboides FSU 785]